MSNDAVGDKLPPELEAMGSEVRRVLAREPMAGLTPAQLRMLHHAAQSAGSTRSKARRPGPGFLALIRMRWIYAGSGTLIAAAFAGYLFTQKPVHHPGLPEPAPDYGDLAVDQAAPVTQEAPAAPVAQQTPAAPSAAKREKSEERPEKRLAETARRDSGVASRPKAADGRGTSRWQTKPSQSSSTVAGQPPAQTAGKPAAAPKPLAAERGKPDGVLVGGQPTGGGGFGVAGSAGAAGAKLPGPKPVPGTAPTAKKSPVSLAPVPADAAPGKATAGEAEAEKGGEVEVADAGSAAEESAANAAQSAEGAGTSGGPATSVGAKGRAAFVFSVVSGPASSAGVKGILSGNAGQLRHCYAQLLRRQAKAAGTMAYGVMIDAGGAVTSVILTSGQIQDSAFRGCVDRRLKAWRFPASSGPSTLTVKWTFAP